MVTRYNYDSVSRLMDVLHKAGDTTVIDGASYTYDNAGNRASKSNYLDNSAEGYTYDALYQLTQVIRNNAVTEGIHLRQGGQPAGLALALDPGSHVSRRDPLAPLARRRAYP